MNPLDLLWIFFILSSLQPVIQRQLLAMGRRRALADIAKKRDATVITMIHRQETMSLLGFRLAHSLSTGLWTHDDPAWLRNSRSRGFPSVWTSHPRSGL